jgi:hypothetical protein
MPVRVAKRALGNALCEQRLPAAIVFRRRRGRARDERPSPPPDLDNTFACELSIGVLNGVGVQAQPCGELSHGRQRLIRLQDADGNVAMHLVDELSVDWPGVVRVDLEHGSFGDLASW